MDLETKTFAFKVVVEPDDGGAYCPALKAYGAVTQGATQDQAFKNINEVVQMIVDELVTEGIPLPSHTADVDILKICGLRSYRLAPMPDIDLPN